MKINIVCVGKMQAEWKAIFAKYQKRIQFWASLQVIEVKEVNHQNKDVQKAKETKLILANLPKNAPVFLCSLQGKSIDSVAFANYFEVDNLTFVIGGSFGVEEKYFPQKISFSAMTFPHQFFRVILVEQIYRALTIKKMVNYHK